MQTLVLDTNYQPLGITTWERAITLFYQDKVEIVQEYADKWIHSVSFAMKMPSVVRFLKKVVKKVRKVKFSRENIFTRDKGKCQYCNNLIEREDFTLDHVFPKSMGGKTSWENIVVCCVSCNRKKANKTPEQAGMVLKIKPTKPKSLFQMLRWENYMPQDWMSFMYWNGELLTD